MLSYCFAWTPLVIVMTIGALSVPWLGLIALMVVSLVVLAMLATLVWTMVWAARVPTLAVRHRWQARSSAIGRTAAAVQRGNSGRPTRSAPAGATGLLANPPSERHG